MFSLSKKIQTKLYIGLHQAASLLNGKSLVADMALVLILAGVFCSLYLAVLDIQVWQHDALIHKKDYFYNLVTEGRWLNYIFFPLLKRLPPHLSIFMCLACWVYFSFVVARRYTDDKRLCFLFVLLSLQLPAFYAVLPWPSTVLSAFVIV